MIIGNGVPIGNPLYHKKLYGFLKDWQIEEKSEIWDILMELDFSYSFTAL